MVGYQAIADIDDPSELRRGWNWTPRGIYAYGPIPGRLLVARFTPQPEGRDAPVSLEELQSAVRDVTGLPVRLTGLHGRATRWSDNARQARSYRRGRVFLAGDAAHVHAPFSAQGLNLGLGDAVNLGWKLAAALQGRAPEGLLDTYERERHPIGAWVLDWTRAQVALMRGDERTARLRHVVADELLAVPGATNHMLALSSGIAQRYDIADEASVASASGSSSALASASVSGSASPADPVGSIAGDIDLADGSRLADHAHDGRFVLVDRSADGRFAASAHWLERRIAYVADPAEESSPSLLVRPDGVIVWAAVRGEEPLDLAQERLDAVVRRWVGV